MKIVWMDFLPMDNIVSYRIVDVYEQSDFVFQFEYLPTKFAYAMIFIIGITRNIIFNAYISVRTLDLCKLSFLLVI